jgi:hypothetical protein
LRSGNRPLSVRPPFAVLAGLLVACASSGGLRPVPSQEGAGVDPLPQSRLACPPGRGDCDGDPGNGCEVDLSADPLNCRACGNACTVATGAAMCMEGRCGATIAHGGASAAPSTGSVRVPRP